MALKARSYRVSDETANKLKDNATKTGRPIQRLLAASVAFFDPLNDEEHMQFLIDFEKQTSTAQLADAVKRMPPEERDKLLQMLENSKSLK